MALVPVRLLIVARVAFTLPPATASDGSASSHSDSLPAGSGTSSAAAGRAMRQGAMSSWAPGQAEAAACALPLPNIGASSTDLPPVPRSEAASPGARVVICDEAAVQRDRGRERCHLPYQLFLPAAWTAEGTDSYPVVVFFHGAGDGDFNVMNSQSLPRLLAADQGTCFDDRACWCLEPEYALARAHRETSTEKPYSEEVEDLRSPMADCTFAERFPAIVIMPQGWTSTSQHMGWSGELLMRVQNLTRQVLKEYRGDPERVVITGQSAGGPGAAQALIHGPGLYSAVNIICSPRLFRLVLVHRDSFRGIPVWVVGYTGDGRRGNDVVVKYLKKRSNGVSLTRYTRYVKAPAPPDPKYRVMLNHASYDLIYRDPRLWQWALEQRNPSGRDAWK